MKRAVRGSIARPTIWVGGTVVALMLLLRSGQGRPGLRMPTDPRAWPTWATTFEPLDVTAGVARSLALVVVGYLLVLAVLHLSATLVPRAGIRRIASVATPRFLVGTLAGVAVLAGVGTAGADPSGGTTPHDAPVMRLIDPAPTTVPPTAAPPTAALPPAAPPSTSPAPTTAPPTTALPPAAPPTTSPAPTAGRGTAPSDVAPTVTSRSSVPAPSPSDPPPSDMGVAAAPEPTDATATVEHTVQPGEHLWSIAEDIVRSRLGSSTTSSVAAYWHRLIEVNRDRLVDADDPSLILPGQPLVLPE